jgi:hypothetical protein
MLIRFPVLLYWTKKIRKLNHDFERMVFGQMILPQNNRDHKNKNLKKPEKKNGEAITILTMTVQKRPNATKNGHTNYIKRFLLSFFVLLGKK